MGPASVRRALYHGLRLRPLCHNPQDGRDGAVALLHGLVAGERRGRKRALALQRLALQDVSGSVEAEGTGDEGEDYLYRGWPLQRALPPPLCAEDQQGQARAHAEVLPDLCPVVRVRGVDLQPVKVDGGSQFSSELCNGWTQPCAKLSRRADDQNDAAPPPAGCQVDGGKIAEVDPLHRDTPISSGNHHNRTPDISETSNSPHGDDLWSQRTVARYPHIHFEQCFNSG
jgi:hypothetical protein